MTIYQVIELLEANRIQFTLASHRKNTVMATAAVPGELWEIEVFTDGSVEMEIFKSNGELYDETMLSKKLAEFGE